MAKQGSIEYGLTRFDDVAHLSAGIALQADGRFCAMTPADYRYFLTVNAAAQWLARRGYSPTGIRLPGSAS